MPTIRPSVPRTYADTHSKLVFLLGYTGPLQGIPANILNEGIDGSCRTTKAGTRFSATDSATETGDAALCDEGSPETLGDSAYEARAEIFRYFDEANPGIADVEADELFQVLQVKGTTVTAVHRQTGKKYDVPFEEEDEYSAFRVETDNWQGQADMTGYIKRTVPMRVQQAELNGKVGAD